MRAALGASRWRLIRQLLTETTLIGLLGGIGGLLLAHWGLYALLKLPQNFVNTDEAGLDTRVLLFALAVSLITGWLFGLLPALQLARPQLQSFLKEGARGAGDGSRWNRLRSAFVVAQVALSLLLLVSAGLLIRSFDKLLRVNVGFKTESLLSLEYRLPRNKYRDPVAQWNFHNQVVERLQEVPGVQSAALVRGLPFSGNGATTAIALPDREPPPKGMEPEVMINTATPNYFETLGIPLIQGRVFGNQDRADTPPVVVINQTMARRFWPNQDPLGKQIKFIEDDSNATVIGVVGDAKHYWLEEEQRPQVYGTFSQGPGLFATVVIRTGVEPLSLSEPVRQAIWKVDPDQPMWKIRTVEFLVDRSTADRQIPHGFDGDLRDARAGADNHRSLRRHQLSGQPTDPGDWHSHGTGCADARHHAHGAEAGNGPRNDRSCFRTWSCLDSDTFDVAAAVPGKRDRSADIRGDLVAASGGRFAGLLHPGAARNESRSVGGAEIRMNGIGSLGDWVIERLGDWVIG